MNREYELIKKIRTEKDYYAKRELVKMFLPHIKELKKQYKFTNLTDYQLKKLYTNIIEEQLPNIDLDIIKDVSFVELMNLLFFDYMIDDKCEVQKLIIKKIENKYKAKEEIDKEEVIKDITIIIKELKFLEISNYSFMLKKSLVLTKLVELLNSNKVLEIDNNREVILEFQKLIHTYSELYNKEQTKVIKKRKIHNMNKPTPKKEENKELQETKKIQIVQPEKPKKNKKISDELYHKLIQENKGLVLSIAKKYINRGVEFDDIVDAGTYGLVMAAYNFDKEKNCEFSTYATKVIKGYILNEFRISKNSVVFTRYQYRKIYQFRKLYNEIDGTTAEKIEKIALKMDITLEEAEDIYINSKTPTSLNKQAAQEDDSTEIIELIKDDIDIEEGIYNSVYLEQLIKKAKLSKREKEILYSYFGMYDNMYHTKREISRQFEVSPAYIGDVIARCLVKIRKHNNITGV